MKKIEKIILAILIFSFFILYFYKIDCSSLESFDEAWYGSIARNMVLGASSNPLLMIYNGQLFTDHPPFGISLIALSGLFFGEFNSLSIRLPALILGVGSFLLIYLIAKKYLNSGISGILTILILGSSLWWILRVRSGNLDITWVFLFLLTIYFMLESKQQPRKFLLVGLTSAFLILTKTLIGFAIFPILIFIYFWQRNNFKKIWPYLLGGLLVFILITFPWYLINYLADQNFLNHHFLEIGLRISQHHNQFHNLDLAQNLLYLQSGVGIWFKILIIGFLLSLFLLIFFIFQKNKKETGKFLFLIFWFLVLSIPLLFSPNLEIWHLIPIYPPLILLSTYALLSAIKIFTKKFNFNNKLLSVTINFKF